MATKKRRPRIDVEIEEQPAPKSRLYIDDDVAEALRKVARAERMELTPMIEMLLRYWLERERPQWKLVESGGQRSGRRGK
ncbi:MAG: hypothetical protein IPM35_17930 [Myxococcales bacterium]|nr:hypothetical protein [Myxococcales bacterium]